MSCYYLPFLCTNLTAKKKEEDKDNASFPVTVKSKTMHICVAANLEKLIYQQIWTGETVTKQTKIKTKTNIRSSWTVFNITFLYFYSVTDSYINALVGNLLKLVDVDT